MIGRIEYSTSASQLKLTLFLIVSFDEAFAAICDF